MRQQKTEAVEVFRQFAWNLAGRLAVPKMTGTAQRRRPAAKPVGKR
jgi:hypothetical protein